ncbi:hypothetical protein JCM21900_004086 [Sporobolomyces salmonicolor]
MPLDPKFFSMGAKTWRHPENEKLWLEQEKKKAAEAKTKAEEDAFKTEVESERGKILHDKLAEAGRLSAEDTQDGYIAKLKADVARLEAKRAGKPREKSSGEKIADHDQARANKEIEERGKETDKEVELAAQAMLTAQEKELAEKEKQQEQELAELAEKRRRELLEYKHFLGLNAKPAPPRRPRRFADRPPALHEDPEFWKLGNGDQHMLEMMSPERRAEYGFGPYEEDEVEFDPELHKRFETLGIGTTKLKEFGVGFTNEGRLEEKMRRFTLRGPGPSPTGFDVVREFEPFALSALLGDLPPPETLSAEDRRAVDRTIAEQRKLLRHDMVKEAILGQGANALLEFRSDGPHPVHEGEFAGQYELVADGVPVRLVPSLARARPGQLPPAAAHDSGWEGTQGRRPPGGDCNNGGAGFEDYPAFGEDLWGMHAGAGAGGGEWNPFGGAGPLGGRGGGVAAAGWGGWGDERGIATGWRAGGQPPQVPLGGGVRGGDGAVWGGGRGRGQMWEPTLEEERPKVPRGLRDLPWGAQAYVKSMRTRQEREMRQAADASTRGTSRCSLLESPRTRMPVPPPAGPPPASPASRTPLEDPALFGNSFARPSDPSAVVAATPRPSQLGGGAGGGGRGGVTGSTARGRPSRAAQREAQTTSDPDHGEGRGGGGAGRGDPPW